MANGTALDVDRPGGEYRGLDACRQATRELDKRIMPLVPFGDYRPDVSDYEGQATRNIGNVIPRGDGYGPFPGLSTYTSALPSACRGAFYALKFDGSVVTFAGTSTVSGSKLYKLDNTNYTWT